MPFSAASARLPPDSLQALVASTIWGAETTSPSDGTENAEVRVLVQSAGFRTLQYTLTQQRLTRAQPLRLKPDVLLFCPSIASAEDLQRLGT